MIGYATACVCIVPTKGCDVPTEGLWLWVIVGCYYSVMSVYLSDDEDKGGLHGAM
jgi:hypothetical protein